MLTKLEECLLQVANWTAISALATVADRVGTLVHVEQERVELGLGYVALFFKPSDRRHPLLVDLLNLNYVRAGTSSLGRPTRICYIRDRLQRPT